MLCRRVELFAVTLELLSIGMLMLMMCDGEFNKIELNFCCADRTCNFLC